MGVTALYTGGLCTLETDNVGPIQLGGVTRIEAPLNIESGQPISDGNVYPEAAYISAVAPEINLTTTDLGGWLAAIPTAGACITTPGSETGFDVWALSHDECDQRDLAGSTKYGVLSGLILPQSIQADHQQDASLNLRVVPTSKAGNAPLSVASPSTMPASAAGDPRWTLWGVTVAGVNLVGVKSVGIDFGIAATTESADGSIYNEWASVGQQLTQISIQGIDPRWLGPTQIPLGGRLAAHANTTIRLRKRLSGGALDDLANEVHIKLTVAGLVHITTAVDASGQDTATTSMTILALHDGTNLPLIISTGATL